MYGMRCGRGRATRRGEGEATRAGGLNRGLACGDVGQGAWHPHSAELDGWGRRI